MLFIVNNKFDEGKGYLNHMDEYDVYIMIDIIYFLAQILGIAKILCMLMWKESGYYKQF